MEVLGTEPRTSCILSTHFTTELYPLPLLSFIFGVARGLFLWVFSLPPGSCVLWVSQLPEIHTQEGPPASLPVPSMPAKGEWPLGLSHGTRTKWPQGRRVSTCQMEVLGLGVGTGNGTLLLMEKDELLRSCLVLLVWRLHSL
ncbi:LOW QUALITY PROTEIN: natural cytotoxicity triggering receptor 3 [Camelus ferus]|uniref:LOW QUALITY PROTEIN: natural cytotoxicity triggering receptor 3 n=2 Tax=Camelus TaxID=9836 RepID=A0A8B8RMN9_CAMFR|nr:LOW QUALITY PROTEIN: natural cytotoxicity triggering receptor 3 [Camelus ferus]